MIQKTCFALLAVSIICCVAMAANNSRGLTKITVTCLDPSLEPNDARLPFIVTKEQLPDYTITIQCSNYSEIKLGTKIDQSAKNGLTWTVPDPVSLSVISGIRLEEEDKLISDNILEIQIDKSADDVTSGNYQFEFETETSFWVGVKSFFLTPIGLAINGLIFFVLLILIIQFIS